MRPRTLRWGLRFAVFLFYRLSLGSRGEAPRSDHHARAGAWPDRQKVPPASLGARGRTELEEMGVENEGMRNSGDTILISAATIRVITRLPPT